MFVDREDAGRQLAQRLQKLKSEAPIVLGIPRGGVPVAYEVAVALDAPLDVWVARKVGAPEFPELGMGAVAEGGVVYLDPHIIAEVGADADEVERLVEQKTQEVAARAARFRNGRPPPNLEGRTVILVDDGVATGGTVRASLEALRAARPGKIVLAVPVAASQTLAELRELADTVVCVQSTPALYAIGAWYENFSQVADEQVVLLLEMARSKGTGNGVRSIEVTIPISDAELKGTLTIPAQAEGLVIFAHGSGSSRFSPRNQHVAAVLQRSGLATLLFDLLTSEEEQVDEQTAELRFDIPLLGRRLAEATGWAHQFAATRQLPIGYFGASTGAAAALVAAAELPSVVKAVVSRGGRPDLAEESLDEVRAPTLLIVGGRDETVLELNRGAASRLGALHELVIVPRATHLFEEPGALDVVARLAADWFSQKLAPKRIEPPAAEAHPG